MNPVPAFTSEKSLPVAGFVSVTNYREYDMIPRTGQFLMVLQHTPNNAPAEPTRYDIHTVVNWFEETKNRVPLPN